MSWTLVFVVMTILICLLLIGASIAATVGADFAFNSTFFNTDPRINSAYQYLIVSSGLGWSTLIVLILVLIIAAIAGGFTTLEVSDDILNLCNPTKADLLSAYRGEKDLSSGYTTQIVVLVVLIILALIVLTMAILTIIASVQIADMKQRDANANNAYISAGVAAGLSTVVLIMMIVAIIAYIYMREERANHLVKIKTFEERAELQLGVTPQQLANMTIVQQPTTLVSM